MKKLLCILLFGMSLGLPYGSTAASIEPSSTFLLPQPPPPCFSWHFVRQAIREAKAQIEQDLGHNCPFGLLLRGFIQGDVTISKMGPGPSSPGMAFYQISFFDGSNTGTGIILAEDI